MLERCVFISGTGLEEKENEIMSMDVSVRCDSNRTIPPRPPPLFLGNSSETLKENDVVAETTR